MSDTISGIRHRRAPAYLRHEHAAAWARTGATWFEWYDADDAPAAKPAGYISRFEVSTAVAMPAHRQAGIALCDDIEAMIPMLSDRDALSLSYDARSYEAALTTGDERSSLIVSGWRYGAVHKLHATARKMAAPTARKAVHQ